MTPADAVAVLRAVLAAWPGSREVHWALDVLEKLAHQREADMAEKEDVIGWAVVELMGHRRLTGYLRPVEIAGAPFLRLDVPGPATKDETGPFQATQFYRPEAVYCITPTTAELAIRANGVNAVTPVTKWDLPQEKPLQAPALCEGGTDFDDPDNDPDSALDEYGGES